MVNIRSGMPVLARHEGEWVGEYIHIDPDGAIQDRPRIPPGLHLPGFGAVRLLSDQYLHMAGRQARADRVPRGLSGRPHLVGQRAYRRFRLGGG